MSFTSIEPATSRLHRSELAVPGSNTALFEKAAKSAADIVFLDVEDAVAPDDKAQARKNIIQGLNEIDWGPKTMMVRINGLDTHYMYRDVVDIVEACPRLDMILIPKTGVAADVYAVDMMVTQIETAMKRTKRIGFEVLIETALGMANVEAIAHLYKSCHRVGRRAIHANLAVPIDPHEAKGRIDGVVDDGAVELIAIDDRSPVMHARAAQRIDADLHIRGPYRFQVDYIEEIANVVAHEVMPMRRRRLERFGHRHARNA